jgi:hypothetical protein
MEWTYEDTSAALGGRALTTKTLDFSIRINLVVFEARKNAISDK